MTQKTATAAHQRDLAILMHLSGYVFFSLPIVIWLFRRNQNRLVDSQGKEWVNFVVVELAALAVFLVAAVALFFGYYNLVGVHGDPSQHPLLLGAGGALVLAFGCLSLYSLILPGVAAYRCSQGVDYRFPLPFRVMKHRDE